MNDLNDICVLVTSCIAPNQNIIGLELIDSAQRKKQYIEALCYLANQTRIKKIVYCDNSNIDISLDVKKYISERTDLDIEWLRYREEPSDIVRFGKGYGEGDIIKYAINNSKVLRNTKWMAKVTGRLAVQNLNQIIKRIEDDDIYIDIRKTNGKDEADTRFYIVKTDVYKKKFIDIYKKVRDRDGIFLEHVFAEELKKNMVVRKAIKPSPIICGISGSTGFLYKKPELKYVIWNKIYKNKNYEIEDGLYSQMVISNALWDEKYSLLERKKIAIFGAGLYGRVFYRSAAKKCRIQIWVDKNYKKISRLYGKKISNPECIKKSKLDYIVIAVQSKSAYEEIYKCVKLLNEEVDILWMFK